MTLTTNSTIMDQLTKGQILLFDGGTGTYLQQHGLEPGDSPERMNLEQPETVTNMARAYFDAGSDMVLTNTFGANRFILSKYGIGDKVREVNIAATKNARAAAPENCFVSGSVGPTGEFIEPLGDVSEQEMYDVLSEQISAQEEGGADAVTIETQMGLEEASIAIRAAKENTSLTVIATMVFDLGPRGYFTMMGVSPEAAVHGLREAGADVVGSNCGNGVDKMVEIAQLMRKSDDGFLAIQSNAGIPIPKKGGAEYPETPEYMSERYKTLAELPVNVLGGCCGTSPDHISAFRKVLNDAMDKR